MDILNILYSHSAKASFLINFKKLVGALKAPPINQEKKKNNLKFNSGGGLTPLPN